MSKELKALEIIKHTTNLYMPNELNGYKEELDIIENALKDKEQTDMLLEQFGLSNIQNFIDNLKIVAREQKKLKALEIIKEKLLYIDFKTLIASTDYVIYCFMVGNKNLTEKEYELLKEVLL